MTSATDYITYFGVPIAVLGVMPIIYNTIVTLITLAKVRRILHHSRLAGIARGDIVNHVIEVELPRYTIAPLHRLEHSKEYWRLSDHPSPIPGGSWTTFNWRQHNTGSKTQRIDHSDQLRQPQAEIGFEELISFLLDLGAVPDAAGFRILRASGLWVPTGTALLVSPNGLELVLTVAPLDDSDGYLSLAVRWSSNWGMRDPSSLPPYWALVQGPSPRDSDTVSFEPEKNGDLIDTFPSKASSSSIQEKAAVLDSSSAIHKKLSISGDTSIPTIRPPQTAKYVPKNDAPPTIRCQISSNGLVTAVPDSFSLSTSLPISHLLIPSLPTTTPAIGTFFASVLTALITSSTSQSTPLWSYTPPPSLLTFCTTPSIPCGILVLLSFCPASATPEWATTYPSEEQEAQEEQMKKMANTSREMMREMGMSPAEKSRAYRDRMAREFEEWNEGLKMKTRREIERRDKRELEAVQSPRWGNGLVAEHTLVWLKARSAQSPSQSHFHPQPHSSTQNKPTQTTSETSAPIIHIPQKATLHEVVGCIMYTMLIAPHFVIHIEEVLQRWMAFTSSGGLKKADYLYLSEKGEMFAYASLVLAVIAEFVGKGTGTEGGVGGDLQECVRVWKRVRLG